MKTLSEVLSNIGSVDEKITLTYLAQATGIEASKLDIDRIDEYIKSTPNAYIYINEDGIELSENINKEAKYIWVSTGLCRGSNLIYIAFCRSYGMYKVYKTGTYSFLMDKLNEFMADKLFEKQNEYDLLEDIYEMLLMKEFWYDKNDYNKYTHLSGFLYTQQQKLEIELKRNEQKNYILNNDSTKLFYNTGLIDYYGNDIYLIMDIDSNTSRLGNPKLFHSKNDMAASGLH